VAFADFDNDGFVDILVANNGDPPLLLHNSGNGNHFINFKLVGTKSNRDAMGARIRIVSGGIPQFREIEGGGSYLSQSDLRANFGVGKATSIDSVEVKWPSGLTQTFQNVPANKFYRVEEGKNVVEDQHSSSAARARRYSISACGRIARDWFRRPASIRNRTVGGLIAGLVLSVFLLPTLYVCFAGDHDVLPVPDGSLLKASTLIRGRGRPTAELRDYGAPE
jgi:hypothetical protein